jgi:inward rectifier potassium channel
LRVYVGDHITMKQPGFDPGLTQQFSDRLRRTINPDGSFNVRRRGVGLRHANPYMALISMPWTGFFALTVATYLLVNLIFAAIYVWVGVEHLKGANTASLPSEFASAFFFSTHTLTTVGYGNIYPDGIKANVVAALEAMAGLMGFALATGLLYGRFSRATARIAFSNSMLIAPYQDGTSLQFRIANQRNNQLIEIEATLMMMDVVEAGRELKRSYTVLPLERPKVYFLPLTWTIVHPIDGSSPLAGKSARDLAEAQTEFLILVKAFDDTFSQTVHARYSYTHNELVWGAKFKQAFHVEEGDMVLEMDRIHEHERLALKEIKPG